MRRDLSDLETQRTGADSLADLETYTPLSTFQMSARARLPCNLYPFQY
jgi:hypothetical protein